MSGTGGTERLGERDVATAVVRVVLDDRGAVDHGELLDAASGTVHRFARWEGLVEALRRWLGQARADRHD